MLPNALFVKLSVASGIDNLEFITTAVNIKLEPTISGDDFCDIDQIKNYLSNLLGAINNIENGNIVVKNSENANNSNIARIAQNVSNPNILINGDFRINQRGLKTYTEHNKYTVDRWQLLYGSLEVNSDGSITHTSTNNWQGLRQYIEYPSRYAGKTVTFSMMADSTSIRLAQIGVLKNGASTATTLANSGSIQAGKTINIFSVTFPADITDNDKLYVLLYTPQANQSVTYYWTKLEIGTSPTEFIPRLYAEELALCQRYYQVINNLRLTGFVSGVGYAATSIHYINEMRIKPTIKVIDKVIIRYGGTNYEQLEPSFNANWSTKCETTMSLNKFDKNPVTDYWNSTTDRNVISLDAEIY